MAEISLTQMLTAREHRAQTQARLLERLLVEIEETGPSGRLLDLDLLDVHGHPVSRESLGLPQRRCLLCNQPAKLCARSRTHTVAELKAETRRRLTSALNQSENRQ